MDCHLLQYQVRPYLCHHRNTLCTSMHTLHTQSAHAVHCMCVKVWPIMGMIQYLTRLTTRLLCGIKVYNTLCANYRSRVHCGTNELTLVLCWLAIGLKQSHACDIAIAVSTITMTGN